MIRDSPIVGIMTWAGIFQGASVVVGGASLIAASRWAYRCARRMPVFKLPPDGIRVLVEDDPQIVMRNSSDQAHMLMSYCFHLDARGIDSVPTPPSDELETWSHWAWANREIQWALRSS